MKREHLRGNFSCPQCGLPLYSVTEVINHMKETKHDQYGLSVCCPTCKVSFTPDELSDHYKICVVETQRRKWQTYNRKEKTCEKCGKVFHNMNSYSSHMKVHLREEGVSEEQAKQKLYYYCDQCPKRYTKSKSLKKHVKTIHEGIKIKSNYKPKSIVCELCGFTCTTNQIIKDHMSVKHENDNKYLCKICGKNCGSQLRLRLHMKKHTEMQFKCSYCGKMFRKKENMEAHEGQHRGDKPAFPCSLCTAQFPLRERLNQHMKGVHKIAGPKGGKTGWVRTPKAEMETV